MNDETIKDPVETAEAIQTPEEEASALEEEAPALEEEATAPETAEPAQKKKKRKRFFKKKDILNITPENDLRYRGPLSCRYMKVLAWLCILFLQISTILGMKEKIVGFDNTAFVWNKSLQLLGSLGVPLLLVSNFSLLLNGSQSYRRMIIKNTALSGGFALAYLYFYFHYIVGLVAVSKGSRFAAHNFINSSVYEITEGKGFVAFNMFLDILVCTLIVFFINYKPKKLFQGKKLIIFRLFTLLPIFYEILCITAKILATEDMILIPMWVFPFLTTKPPLTFLIFVIAAIYIKRRESYFLKNGKTSEDYQRFLKTNTNSFQFSILLSGIIIVVGIVDLLLFIMITIMQALATGQTADVAATATLSWGFGNTSEMLIIVPLMLLFSYNKTYKNVLVDLLVPVVAVFLIVYAYLEGIFDIARTLLGMTVLH